MAIARLTAGARLFRCSIFPAEVFYLHTFFGQIIGTTTFEEMAAKVESIKFCCIRDKQNDSLTIKPVWLMTVSGDCRFWFDPETGELLGYLRAEVN